MSCVLCNQAMKLVNYIFVSCPYRTIIWSLSPWPILTNSLVILTPSDLVKYVIFPQWYLKIPSYYWMSQIQSFCHYLFDIGDCVTKPSLLSTSQILQKLLKRLLKKKNYPGHLSASLNTNIETKGLYNWI